MGGTGRKIRRIQVMLTIMLALCIMACGKEAQTDRESGNEAETEHETADSSSEEDTSSGDEQETELPENVIEAYITENTEYTEEVIEVQYVDDLSLLADLKYTNSNYVYQDGKVYYRRYHEDSYEDKALWGDYDAVPGREKEIVCIDADGTETVLFTDKGNGDIYLINDRFYMRGSGTGGEDESGDTDTGDMLYSVDMQGNDRIDYGRGMIYAVDTERKIFILKMWDYHYIHYYVMNYETGEKKPLFHDSVDGYIDIGTYQDGWIYYESRDYDSTVCKLCAVSIEGEQREIIAITSEIDGDVYRYHETILNMEVDGDRVYFIFGGYDGSASIFQGGMLISVKLDGTDYKAVWTKDDAFYLSHNKGKTLVYFSRYCNELFGGDNRPEEYDALVWDVEADICYRSDFPINILYYYNVRTLMWRYYPADMGALCNITTSESVSEIDKTDVYAIPDDSGKIVRVVMDIEKYTTKWEEEEAERVTYEDFYFADGFLYFKTEYSTYDKETSVGWRESYRRLHTDIYRLKIGESKAKILYSY